MKNLMRVLLVEDEEATVRQIQGLLEKECHAVVEVARSRDSALTILDGDDHFDLVVCDLKIPTRDRSLDPDEDHGLRVHDVARSKHPGTFSRFFSGYVRLDNVGTRLSTGPSIDVFGTGENWALVDAVPKSRQPEFLQWANELSVRLQDLDQLPILQSVPSLVDEFQTRTLRIYATRLEGSQIVASPLSGLSAARVLRVEILDHASASVGLVVAKVDLLTKVEDELKRYRQFVAPLQRVGAFAPLVGEVLHGCGRFGAAFYSLAANGYTDLFRLSATDVARSRDAVNRLQASHQVWKGNVVDSSASIGSLRSDRISDDELAPWMDDLGQEPVRQVESLPIPLNESIQHGDLHGLNVLVDAEGRPLIIDYGDLGQHPAALDPVTLELSFIFHAESPDLGGWPSVEQASHWFEPSEYTRDCPLSEVVEVCRQWALSVATKQQLAAVVYVHAVRQLKYSDTKKPLALAIARAAMAELLDE